MKDIMKLHCIGLTKVFDYRVENVQYSYVNFTATRQKENGERSVNRINLWLFACHDDKIELIAEEKNYLTLFCNTRNDVKVKSANCLLYNIKQKNKKNRLMINII